MKWSNVYHNEITDHLGCEHDSRGSNVRLPSFDSLKKVFCSPNRVHHTYIRVCVYAVRGCYIGQLSNNVLK